MVIRRRAWTKREGLWQHYVLIVFHIGGRDRIRDKRAMTKPYEIAHRRITKINNAWASVPENPPADLRT